MHVRRLATSVEVQTPAKLNLFLEVLGKRSDGYHEIETLIVPLWLYDTLILTPTDDGDIELDCRWASGAAAKARADAASAAIYGEIAAGHENLVWRAAQLIRAEAGISKGAMIQLVKRIPTAAGLGGGSSDAAAALIAANIGWKLNWPRERLIDLAARIGSDVPFFLLGGSAICRGRGEDMESIAARRLHAIVVRPPVGIASADAYKACQPAKTPAEVGQIKSALARGNAGEIGKGMVNRLQPVANQMTPWIDVLETKFKRQDLLGQQMSGSGSSYFGICRSARSARRMTARLRSQRSGAVFAAMTAAALR
jgi:4-diphosphocytidyl-2-C-methyl-D-erythritol kinase